MSNEAKRMTADQARELAKGPRKKETIDQVLELIRYAANLGGGEIELYYYDSQIIDVLKDLGYYVDVEPHCITVHWGGAV